MENKGVVKPIIQVIPSNIITRKTNAKINPNRRAIGCLDFSKSCVISEIKIILSIPKTISSNARVHKDMRPGKLKIDSKSILKSMFYTVKALLTYLTIFDL